MSLTLRAYSVATGKPAGDNTVTVADDGTITSTGTVLARELDAVMTKLRLPALKAAQKMDGQSNGYVIFASAPPRPPPWAKNGQASQAVLSRAAEHGHHIPGTPYHYRHGWIPVAPYFKTPGDLAPGDIVEFRGRKHMVIATPSQIAAGAQGMGVQGATRPGRPDRRSGVFLRPVPGISSLVAPSQVKSYTKVAGTPAPGHVAARAPGDVRQGDVVHLAPHHDLRSIWGPGWGKGAKLDVMEATPGDNLVKVRPAGRPGAQGYWLSKGTDITPARTGTKPPPVINHLDGAQQVANAVNAQMPPGESGHANGLEILALFPPHEGESPRAYRNRLAGLAPWQVDVQRQGAKVAAQQADQEVKAGIRPGAQTKAAAAGAPSGTLAEGQWVQTPFGSEHQVIAVFHNAVRLDDQTVWNRHDLHPTATPAGKRGQSGAVENRLPLPESTPFAAYNHGPAVAASPAELRPAGNPGKVTVVGHAVSPGQAEVQGHLDSGIDYTEHLGAGAQGTVDLVHTKDGGTIVRKKLKQGGWDAETMADSEYYAAQVAEAITGTGASPVIRAKRGKLTIYEKLAPGDIAVNHYSAEDAAYDTPRGLRIGLLDYLIDNGDRHDYNWMLDGSQPVPIDNSSGFGVINAWGWNGSPFSEAYQREFEDGRPPMTVADLEAARARLEAERADWVAGGREDWLDTVESRLDGVIDSTRAGGRSLADAGAF